MVSCRGQGGQGRRANRGLGRREQGDGGGGFTGHNADSESSWRRPELLSSEQGQGQGRREQVTIFSRQPTMGSRLPFCQGCH